MENPIEIQTYLTGVDYPATKQDLVRTAEKNGANTAVLDALNSLSETESYNDLDDILSALA